MGRYEITQDSRGDWDLKDGGQFIAFWGCTSQRMYPIWKDFKYLQDTPATEAHGLMLLNMVKQQLEAEDEKTDSI